MQDSIPTAPGPGELRFWPIGHNRYAGTVRLDEATGYLLALPWGAPPLSHVWCLDMEEVAEALGVQIRD